MLAQKPGAVRSYVESLLAEGIQAARQREQTAFDQLAGPFASRIVLFGAGGLGRRALAGLRSQGIEPIAFCDNNPGLWNTQVEGLPVLHTEQAVRRFGQGAVFVVTIWGAHPKDRMEDRIKHLQSLGCGCVIPFAPLFWKYPGHVLPHYGADLPHKVIEQAFSVLEAFDLWEDEQSRLEYVAQLRWRLFFDCAGLPAPVDEPIYFPGDLLKLRPDEVFVDCGAFDGDTVRLFLQASGGSFHKIIALEPDAANFLRLQQSAGSLSGEVRKRIHLECAAAGAINGTVSFSAQGAPSSFVGEGNVQVRSVRLDDLLAGLAPTFIKMDIEGAEPDALLGAASAVSQFAPVLAISCYHRQDHLWSIPLLMRSLNRDYRFYLRPHDVEMWDLVCYGIPRSRKEYL